MKKFLPYILTFIITHSSFIITNAQWYDPEKVNPKATAIYEQAYNEAKEGKYDLSIQHINEAIKLDAKFVDAYLSIAGIYADKKDYQNSITNFEKGFALDSVYARHYLLPWSISLAGTGQFEKALQAVNKFLLIDKLNEQSKKAGNFRKGTYEFAIQYAKTHNAKQYVFTPLNLGDSINSSYLEYFPSFTIDGSKMIFTRRVKSDEDFYESDFINNKWSSAKLLAGNINTNLNEGAQTIAQDGSILIFTGCNYPEGFGSCDLYISYKTKKGWSEPENLGGFVNTDAWESSPSLSPDKKDLYFASNRFGGLGGKDIWVSHRLPNNKWSRPENLGEAVNTSGDESCPFMHADNETLYFNSNGLKGYGSTDLFFAKKINDSSWLEAENLGYPINTIDDEGSLIVAADGKTAYFASERSDSKGGLDLYSFILREDIRPLKTLWVKGKVYDKKTNAPLPSTVELTDVKTKNVISRLQTDEEGNYLTTLPVGKQYAFNVNRKNYLLFSENYDLTLTKNDSVFTKDIPLTPIEAGAMIVLKNIFFDTKKFNLKPESAAELDKVVQLLKDNPKLKIQISGHTDNVGKPKDNLLLSTNRAKSVLGYLLQKGIAPARLTSKGFGSTKPVADNKTEIGKAQNRRTEMTVVSN